MVPIDYEVQSRWPKALSVLFVVLMVVIFAWPRTPWQPPEISNTEALLLFVSLAFGLAAIGSSAVAIIRADHPTDMLLQVMIVSVTVLSFFAYGWAEGEIKITDLAAILILFTLSEMVVVLSSRSGRIAEDMASLATDFSTTSEVFRSADMPKLVDRLTALNRISSVVASLEDAEVRSRTMEAVAEYVDGWATHFGEQAGRREVLSCLQNIFECYLREELADLVGDEKSSINFTTSEKMYFDLLQSLAKFISRAEGKPWYRALVHILPEEWYNIETVDEAGKKRVRVASYIKDYRSVVEQILADEDAIFERGIVVSAVGSLSGQSAVSSPEKLEESCQLALLEVDSESIVRANVLREILREKGADSEDIEDWLGSESFDTENENKLYAILPQSAAVELFGDGEGSEIELKSMKYNITWRPLVDDYVDRIHSGGQESAVVFKLSDSRDLQDHFPYNALDWLLVGAAAEGEAPEWFLGMASDYRPGLGAMRVRVVLATEQLNKLDRFWEDRQRIPLLEVLDASADIASP